MQQNIQDIVTQMVAAARDKRMQDSPQLTLGQLILELESIHENDSADKPKAVCFDFGSAIPTKLDSWRGSYAELALGYKLTGYDSDNDHMAEITVAELLAELRSAVGKTFEGWKGGDFTMDADTPVWVSNPGNADNTIIIGLIDRGYDVVLLTTLGEY